MDMVTGIVEKYIERFPGEESSLQQLVDLINNCDDKGEIFSRKNTVGHITASGIVISRRNHEVLMLHHDFFQLYLQPGGHVSESDKSPLEAARENVKGATSIPKLDHMPFHFDENIPIDIDTHHIPEDQNKDEAPHWHHDFRYLFFTDSPTEKLDINESKYSDYKWCDINELARMATFSELADKINDVLSRNFRIKIFYSDLIDNVELRENVSTIVIAHFLPDVPFYLLALDEITDVTAVLPKPKSINENIYKKLDERLNIHEVNRDKIKNTDLIKKLISEASHETVLYDIGGYFAPVLDELAESFPDKLIGVVEDTENGHQRYEDVKPLPTPVFSVARSSLKVHEDFLVGQSVLFSADVVLREIGKLIQYMECSVLGFGKIGSSIAHHLLLRGVKPMVYDRNPIKRIEAYNRHCNVPGRKEIMEESDVIFCATGNSALSIKDFRQLKDGCIIFSVTSSDDEMDLTYINSEYNSEEVSQSIIKYFNFNNYFYLVNEGNAVNFIHNAVLGDFIHAVRGEMIYISSKILSKESNPGLYNLREDERKKVAEIWLENFVSFDQKYNT